MHVQDLFAFDALAVTAQVDVSRDGPSGTGTKHARDAGGCSTGQTHTHTHKSRRMSRVGSDGKQLTQVGLSSNMCVDLMWACAELTRGNFQCSKGCPLLAWNL